MAISSQYISDADFQNLLNDLNVQGMSAGDQQGLVDRAEGDLESALCVRFVVPLALANGGGYAPPPVVPKFAFQKVSNAIRAKIRSVLALDKNRNTTFEMGQKFINLHEDEFKAHVKELCDPAKVFGFQLTGQAQGALEPLQSLGLARSDERMSIDFDRDTPFP